jgi:acetyl esterase/lipase
MTEETPPHKRPVVYTLPGLDSIELQRDLAYNPAVDQDLRLDAYLPSNSPPDTPLPGVLFIHGGPVPAQRGSVKESGQYRSWGALAAASGLLGFTFNHQYNAPEQLEQSVGNVIAAVEYIRQQASTFNLDPDRLCLWTCSGGGPHICFALRDRPAYVRCLVLYYAILDLRPVDWLVSALGQETAYHYSAVAYIEKQPLPFPIFIGRAGLDHPGINQTIDNFVAQALQANTALEVMNHPVGEHGFDIMNDDTRSRQIVARTLAFIRENL